jgi:tetratricopeptide (TPR) repeat protein
LSQPLFAFHEQFTSKLVSEDEYGYRMYNCALARFEKTWGPDHISTVNTVNNFGILYADQGRLADAERMYNRALAGYEKAWGPDHTFTLRTVNNLGDLYRAQGRLADAERMHNRAATHT